MDPARDEGLPTISDTYDASVAAEKERKRKEEERRRKAAENAARGMDPNGRPLKAKDRPANPNAPKPRVLADPNKPKGKGLPIPDLNPLNLGRRLIQNDGKEGGWAVIKEPLRALDKGFTGVVEGIGEFAIWGGLAGYSATQRTVDKVLKTSLPDLPKSWDPLEKEYREVLFGSMSEASKPNTTAGKVGADILTFALTTFGVARQLPKTGLITKSAGKSRITKAAASAATGLPAGAAADFMLTKAGDPNLVNVVRDLPFVKPEDEDSWVLGLASSRTDNAFVSKLKATISGGAVGTAADSLAYLLFARKATQGFLKQGLPPEEALQRGVAVGAEEATQAKKARTDLSDKQWPAATASRLREIETKRVELETELAGLDAKVNARGAAPEPQETSGAPAPLRTSPELDAAEKRFQEALDAPEPNQTEFDAAESELNQLREKEKDALLDRLPPKADEVDPETSRIEELNQQLADLYEEKAQLEMDLGTPDSQLRPEDQATFDESIPPSKAAADQTRLETSIPKIARRPDADPEILKGATSPTLGKSPSVFTDAFYKIISTNPSVDKATLSVIRQTASDMDLRALSKAAGRPISEVVANAARFIDNFSKANASAGDQVANGSDLIDLLRSQKLTKTVTEDGTSQEILNAQGIVAAKTIITDTANQIFVLAKSLDELYAAGRNPGNQMDRLVDRLVTISELHKLTGYESGYSLRMFQEMIGGQGTARQAKPMNPSAAKAQETRRLKEWATKIKKLTRAGQDADAQEELQALVRQLVLNGGDPAGTIRQTDLLIRAGAQLAMDNIYNSILSGPITQLRNTAGNLYSMVEKPLSIGLTGVFANNPAARYASVAAYRGLTESLSDAFQVMRTSFATGEPLQINRRFVLQEASALADLEAIRLTTGDGTVENMALGVIDTLYRVRNNPLFNWSSRALTAGDDFFKVINSRMKISMDAAYAAYDAGLSPKELDARYAEIYTQKFQSSFHDDLQIKDEALLDYADATTFQDNPGGFINRISNLIEAAPILRLAMPFVRTPYNLMVYGAQHFPLLNKASSRARAVLDSMPGDPGFDPVAKATMQGRQAIGATVAAAAAMGALNGQITGNGPPAGPARDLWLQEHKPRSIKVGGKWVSYETIEPINNYMAIAADAVMLAKMGHVEAGERIIGQLGFALAISVVDKSYLSGLSTVAGFLDPKTYTSGIPLARGLVSTVNNVLPLAGTRRAMANTLNPYLREIDGELNKMMAVAVPGFALAEQFKIDPFTGKAFTSVAGGWYNAISPFRIYDSEFPEGTEEALGQSVAVGLSEASWDSSTLTTKLDQGEKIAADERADFARALYKVRLAPRLKALFGSEAYKQALAGFKARSVSLDPNLSEHTQMINTTIRQAKAEARAYMLSTSEKWRNRSDLVQQQRVTAGRGDINTATQIQQAIDALQ
jgi:hypothetical protein